MTSYGATKEIDFPKLFNGERTELKRFLQETQDYLLKNKEIYDTDDRKIGFILSFMDDGDAGAWKENFISCAIVDAEQRGEDISFGSFGTFKEKFKKFFLPCETPKNSNDETMESRMRQILRRARSNLSNELAPTEPTKRFPLWKKKRNLNNTNTDRLSNEERTRLMREGRCFKCKQHGHLSRDCPPDEEPKKWNAKSLADYIRALVAGLDEEEKKSFAENVEGEGLGFLKRKTTLKPMSPTLDIYSVMTNIDSQSMNIPMSLSLNERETVETDSLLDSGAGGIFIDQIYARKLHLDIKMLDIPIKARNVDGTENKRGTIKSYVNLQFKIGDKDFVERFFLTGLGKQKIILGFPWLREHNPLIDWQTGRITWQNMEQDTRNPLNPSMEEEEDQELWKTRTLNPTDNDLLISYLEEIKDDELWINAKTNIAVELAIKENEREGKKEITAEELVPEDLHDFLDVFNEKQADRFPDSRPWDHKIEMKEGFEPKSFKVYNLTPTEQTELDKFLKENLDKGYIRPSQSPMASPFFFVTKKDGRLRPCQDYRYLNDWTIKNAYPLPLISEIMDKLKGAKYFTKFDVKGAYNNIRIRTGDEWKGAFKTNRGLYEPTVMFFGMCNSPATFQSMMDSVFAQEIEGNLIIVYMDDILIFASNLEDLARYERIVLQKLRENDLYLKPKKCEFREPKVEYLGMVIKEGQISMDPVKLGGIRDWPIPTTVKEVRSFLGFGNFYHRFIRGFSELAQPLNDLLKKDKKFEWTPNQQHAFETLKKQFTEEPVLMMPDHSKPFQIEVDASKYATGAILTQTDSNGNRHPCAFISRTMSQAQRNYDTGDRELLAIIRALEEWRHYIQGSPHMTTIYSDHANLGYFKLPQTLSPRQARWALYVSEFDLKLVHIPGSKNVLADALSRRPDLCPDEPDNKDIVMLPEHLFINLIDTDLQRRIASAKDLDFDAAEAIKGLLEQGPTPLRHDLTDWEIEDFDGENVLFYKGKNYIPQDMDLRRDIVKNYHDHSTAGHPGELQTFTAVQEHYW